MVVLNRHFFLVGTLVTTLLSGWQASGRENILERAGKPIFISRRRFIQTEPTVLQRLRETCPGDICKTLADSALSALLAVQPECSQQDTADSIIDASRQFDSATGVAMVTIAVQYRQLEKNTPPDYSTGHPKSLNSVYCQRAPRNPELNGLIQAQDPANDPSLFFDPSLKATVVIGSHPNTFPFVQRDGQQSRATAEPTKTGLPGIPLNLIAQQQPLVNCGGVVKVKVTGNPIVIPSGAVVVIAGNRASSTASPSPTTTPTLPGNADFGECSIPKIEFGPGYDNRRETSFRPADRDSFNHESAQDITIISQFVCDTLSNICGANQIAKDLCTGASQASLAAPARTGGQADAFNALFGIATNFTGVVVRDDQGNIIPPSTTVNSPSLSSSLSPSSLSTPLSSAGAGVNPNNNNGLGNFGSCGLPKIDFGAGFDGGPETRFRAAFGQVTSTNINVIADTLCDNVAGICGGDATAILTCARARAAAAAAPNGTGAQADAFNAVFGAITNFASIPPVDDFGRSLTGAPPSPSAINNGGRPRASSVIQNNGSGGNGGNGGNIATRTSSTAPSPKSISTPVAVPTNFQLFTGSVGGIVAPAVTAVGDGQFQVAGNSIINSQREAVIRSCNVQNNLCSDAANASRNQNGFTVTNCGIQEGQCLAQAG